MYASQAPCSTRVTYVLWFFGLHYLYLRKPGLFFLFWLTGGGLLVWWLIDLFRVPGLVDEANGFDAPLPTASTPREESEPSHFFSNAFIILGLAAIVWFKHDAIVRFLNDHAPVKAGVAGPLPPDFPAPGYVEPRDPPPQRGSVK